MPWSSRIGVPCRKRASGAIRRRSWPSADQSRCASSISLSDFEIQTARRRPFSQLSSRMPDLAALAGAGAIAQEPAAAEADSVLGVVECGRDHIECLIDRPRAGEITCVGLAGIDDALELGVGQQAVGNYARRQMRPIAGLGRRDRGHGGRLHQPRWVSLRSRNTDRLEYVSFIKRICDASALRRPVNRLVGEFDGGGFDHRRSGCARRPGLKERACRRAAPD
jgi:hypothetical protein